MRANWGETAIGFVVLALAGLCLVYSLGVVNAGRSSHSYELTAKVGDSGGLSPGAKVTIGGVKIGSVTAVTLDPKSYLAVIHLSVDSAVALSSDTTAKITSDGLLGGAHVALTPGGAQDNLKPGEEISNTQGAIDLLGLIGQFIRPHDDKPGAGAANGAAGAAGSAAPATPASTPAKSADPYPAGAD